ncbi:histone methyltransferase activity (H3-K4 specific) [Coemansia javaensis]|uniref:Histone methyltransferase activity (H3-K4 specific) n=1 Tax=Coemansia javaensis TaxID=2761396 RepID=A0A9W8H8R3_9FUNG|nr:histone methyltransferase activity (H3-K4 specific) [Coemansia javaensis]
MGGERQQQRGRGGGGGRAGAAAAGGKVSVGQLVEERLLAAGSTVVCNSWPFRAVVTEAGAFAAQWQPLPDGFVAGAGAEFMHAEFVTPSAWATAVCRVMRAQARAQRAAEGTGTAASAAAAAEIRVAVNGWTACRVLLPGGAEVSLDALRRELVARNARRARAARQPAAHPPPPPPRDSDSEPERALAAEISEISGLAQRVESGLALGGARQRRAAAAAAGAISAAAGALTLSAAAEAAGPPHANEDEDEDEDVDEDMERLQLLQSRKRKSIPDLSRSAKLSRVPAGASDDDDDGDDDDGDDVEEDEAAILAAADLDAATRACLARYCARAAELKRAQPELRALRYRRRQQLRRRISDAIDRWLRRRRRQRQRHARTQSSTMAAAAGDASSPLGGGALPLGLQQARGRCGNGGAPDTRVFGVQVPLAWLGGGGRLPRLCAVCGAAGGALDACGGCGDAVHAFCAAAAAPGARVACPACRVCDRCLLGGGGGGGGGLELLQCAACGTHRHAACSAQRADHAGGLAAAVAESGRWLCDGCVRCAECGAGMAAGPADAPQHVSWAHDFSVCGPCALHIERARVCPLCLATHAAASAVSNRRMVCCDVCAFWVHADCDPALTPPVYDALLALEDAPYVCPRCDAAGDALLPEPDDDDDARSALGGDDDDDDSDDSMLPRCLRALGRADPRPPAPAAAEEEPEPEPEPEPVKSEAEAANLLLSLTRSDVRFGPGRFDVDALEVRYCVPTLATRPPGPRRREDWRCCALCGLRGDGARGPRDAPSLLGRLVPLRAPAAARLDAARWVHVECLAWAWGPRPVAAGEPPAVRFEGPLVALQGPADRLPCTLCARPGASFHCCAPVPCAAAAYHLPCLLLAATAAPHLLPGHAQYCAAWRRALCADHAPAFSPMMPAPGADRPSYDAACVEACVEACVAQANGHGGDAAADQPIAAAATLVGGGLLVLDWGEEPPARDHPLCSPGLRCVRVFDVAGTTHAMGITARPGPEWAGWLCRAVPHDIAAPRDPDDSAPSLRELVARLIARVHLPPDAPPLVRTMLRAAVVHPLAFLGLGATATK